MVAQSIGKSKIKVGVSSCLLGQKVRYDSGHKRDRYVTDVLGRYFKFVPVCPEVELGMGVPRESVELRGKIDSPRMVGNKTGTDWTVKMNRFVKKRLRQLESENLSGYILKKKSPSCGMERVKIYDANGVPSRKARGLWGGGLLGFFPILPVEEEGRLNDPRLRENFIVRVFAFHNLQQLFTGRFDRGEVVQFHMINKYLLLAHSQKHYKQMGQLVAAVKKYRPTEFKEKYTSLFMEALRYKTTTRKNTNVVHHILGFLKNHLDPDDKQYILSVIDDYHNEIVPLVVPLTLLKHYVDKFNIEYIKNQTYLNPHPKELMLRNHV